MVCFLCKEEFQRQGKSYKRTRLGSHLTSIGKDFTLREALVYLDLFVPTDAMKCACHTCAGIISRYAGRKKECEDLEKAIMSRIAVPISVISVGTKRFRTPSPDENKRLRTSTSIVDKRFQTSVSNDNERMQKSAPVCKKGTSSVGNKRLQEPSPTKIKVERIDRATSPGIDESHSRNEEDRYYITAYRECAYRHKVIRALMRSHYDTMFNCLIKHSAAARVAFQRVCNLCDCYFEAIMSFYLIFHSPVVFVNPT